MLIPLIFKNNDTDSVKTKIGKVTPNMSRLLYAYSLRGKTGILKDYASECSITIPVDYASNIGYGRVTFNKGVLSVCGGIVYIEQGTTFDIPVTSDMQNASLGVRVDLSRDAGNEVEFFYKTGSLTQNDLQDNETSGVYEFDIYKFNVTSGLITLTQKTDKVCTSIDQLIEDLETGVVKVKEAEKATKIIYSSTAPTSAPNENELIIYVGSTLPSTRYDRVLYLIG